MTDETGKLLDDLDAADRTTDRLAAAREIGKAQRAISSVRIFFWTMAVLFGLLALIAGVLKSPWLTGIAAMFVVGAVDVRRRPVVLAVLLTVFAGFAIVHAPDNEKAYVVALMAFAAWTCVPWMRKTQALMKKYPDMYVVQRLTGAPRAPKRLRKG